MMSSVVEKVVAGDVRAVARLIRDIDDGAPGIREVLKEPLTARYDGSVKSPISALCCILRHCGVEQLRLIPQDLHAFISNIFRNRLYPDFLREHQV
jgi:hypothetical protein